jgi:transaldolase
MLKTGRQRTSSSRSLDHPIRPFRQRHQESCSTTTSAKRSSAAQRRGAFFELALEIHQLPTQGHSRRTGGIDGCLARGVALLAYAASTTARANDLHGRASGPTCSWRSGTQRRSPAIEESIFAGADQRDALFSRVSTIWPGRRVHEDWRASSRARPEDQLGASVFISRWDKAVMGKTPEPLRDKLGIAIAKRTYKAYRDLLASERWQKLAAAGARPQRLLFASTGTKDPKASDVLYIESLEAPDTINTIPEETLQAFAEHGTAAGELPVDGGDAEPVLAEFKKAGVDIDALAATLQKEGAESFDKSWNELMECLTQKSDTLKKAS